MTKSDLNKRLKQLFFFDDIPLDIKKNRIMKPTDRIFEILTRSYFRIGPVDHDMKKTLRTKIGDAVKQKLPITLIICYGGYKNHRIDSSPHIDWAEVFQLSFVLRNLYEISTFYSPGIHIEYSGDTEAIEIINNHRKECLKTYAQEFEKMLTKIQLSLPNNIKLTANNIGNFYSIKTVQAEIDKRLADFKLPQEELDNEWGHAENSFCFDGENDYSQATRNEKQELIKKSILIDKLYLTIDYELRRDYIEGGINIPVAHRQFPGCYPIPSCKGCIVQFWEGKGILTKKNDVAVPFILSANQYNSQKNSLEISPVNTEFEHFPGLREIPVKRV